MRFRFPVELGLVAARVGPGPFRDHAQAVDAGLYGHDLLALLGIPPFHGVNLARERIELAAIGDLDEERKLVVARAATDRALEEVNLLARELVCSLQGQRAAVTARLGDQDGDCATGLRYCLLRGHHCSLLSSRP